MRPLAQQSWPAARSSSAGRILIAGIGNIFMGDDAFGCEVVSELSREALPENVMVRDFGIRSYDLAYALVEDYRAIILVDAVSRGASPGTVFLIEPEIADAECDRGAAVDPHAMNVMAALQSASAIGKITARLYLVGCEPSALEWTEGQPGLSDGVRAAVPQAIEMVESLIAELLEVAEANASLKRRGATVG
jgi:hydrogenase maturation protease